MGIPFELIIKIILERKHFLYQDTSSITKDIQAQLPSIFVMF